MDSPKYRFSFLAPGFPWRGWILQAAGSSREEHRANLARDTAAIGVSLSIHTPPSPKATWLQTGVVPTSAPLRPRQNPWVMGYPFRLLSISQSLWDAMGRNPFHLQQGSAPAGEAETGQATCPRPLGPTKWHCWGGSPPAMVRGSPHTTLPAGHDLPARFSFSEPRQPLYFKARPSPLVIWQKVKKN